MTNDVLESLTAYRPSSDSVDSHWPQPARRATLERILASAEPATPAQRRSTRPYTRRRRRVTAVVLSAGAALAVAVPVALPSRAPGAPVPAGAGTLDELAVIAAQQAAPPGGDQYRHAVTELWNTVGEPKHEIDESWTSYDGHVWVKSTADGHTSYGYNKAGSLFPNLSPEFMASLPTHPAALRRWLVAQHGRSGGAKDDAKIVFGGVGSLWKGGGDLPSAVAAAAIRVLEQTPGIAVARTHDRRGREALRADWQDYSQPGSVESLYFDPTTAAFLGVEYSGPGNDKGGATIVSDGASTTVPTAVATGVRRFLAPAERASWPRPRTS